MKKLYKYSSKSSLMNLKLSYGSEQYSFNLFEENKIDEEAMNKELKEHPSSYGFLSMLHKRMIHNMKLIDLEKKRLYQRLLDKYTEVEGTKAAAERRIALDRKYQAMSEKYLEAELNKELIEVCVRTFEQRKDLLQTLSANVRKERT